MPTLRTSVETLVFLGLAALAAAIAVIYWFVSYEAAGSVLLAGFALACAIIGLRLAAALRAAARAVPPNDEPGWPAADPDRPFLDEHGRVPTPTFGPGWNTVPSCRTMIDPARQACPPNTLTPRRCALESRPLRDDP